MIKKSLFSGCERKSNTFQHDTMRVGEKPQIQYKPLTKQQALKEKAINKLERYELIFDHYLETKSLEDGQGPENGKDFLVVRKYLFSKKNRKYLKKVRNDYTKTIVTDAMTVSEGLMYKMFLLDSFI